MTIDSLRADLAETKLLNHDLTKQLEETKAKLLEAESRAMAATATAAARGAENDGATTSNEAEAAAAVATAAAQESQQTTKMLEKEVNGLNTKTRMLEVHNNLLVEQEKDLRASFDQVLLFGGLLLLVLLLLLAAELTGWLDIMDMHGKGACDCTGAEQSTLTNANDEL